MDIRVPNTEELVVKVAHFNWNISQRSVATLDAQANLNDDSFVLSIFDTKGQPHKMQFPLGEGARELIVERMQNNELKFFSILLEDSTFTSENVDTSESMQLLALGGNSSDQFHIAVFVASPGGERAQIANADFHTLCVESLPDGFQVTQDTSDYGGCILNFVNLASRLQPENQETLLIFDENSVTLNHDDSSITLVSRWPNRKILEALTDDKKQIVVLSSANFFKLDEESLANLGSLELVATDEDRLYVVLSAQEGCEGEISDEEGFTYHLSFKSEGFRCDIAECTYQISFEDDELVIDQSDCDDYSDD